VLDEGDFPMGDDNHAGDEKPRHPRRVASYYIDKFEVTNEQFRRFRQAVPGWEPVENPDIKPLYQNNPRFPVIGVGWDDAAAYAKSAGKRLPTEAEWEKAASWDRKLKQKYQFPWGDTLDMNRVSFARQLPSSVDDFPGDVSAYGVRGMGGNAAEWVADNYDRYAAESPADPSFNDGTRVVRGGSFNRKETDQLRTTYRGHRDPNDRATASRATAIGFRCAVSVDDPALQQFLRGQSRKK
jgi:gamma-glutamyl hercynylcysteine S-oxide synthase